jgi:hypothetical protein
MTMTTFQLALPDNTEFEGKFDFEFENQTYDENNFPSPPVLLRQTCWGDYNSHTPRGENLPSPPPLLRENCLGEFYPPLEEQLSKIYKLNTGNLYGFKENFSVHSKKRIEHSVLITGTFLRYKNLKVFEFIVDGKVLEFNYRNFSRWHNPTLFLVVGEELV